MYKVIKYSIFFCSLILLNGCASSCGSAVETNSNTNEVIVPKRATNVKVPDNSNTNNMVNGLKNINGNNPTLDNSKVKVIDTSNVKPTVPTRKMPDNSEMSTQSRGADFVETRKFLNDPQLDKIERILNGKNVKFKVYLKNGKVFDLEEDKLKNYKSATAAAILGLVGIKTQVKVDPNAKTKEQIQKEEEKNN
jgi:hypothetical protein